MLQILALIGLVITSTLGCTFEGLLASCPMILGGHHVQVSARINHCHTPIDVSFLVMANNDRSQSAHNTDTSLRHRPLYWHYTYVTTNQPESRELPGYGTRIMLHVVANTRTELGGHTKRVSLKAQFLLDGQTDATLTFVDDNVRIPHFDDCQYAQEEDHVGKIALGCIVTVILLCVLGLTGLWFFRPNKAADDEVDLVNNMERTHNTSTTTTPTSRRPPQTYDHNEMNVHYVVPKPDDSSNGKEELNVYISTPNGLKKVVERRSSQNSERSYSSSSGKSNPSSSLRNENNARSSKMSSTSDSSSESGSLPDRSLGAIPKRKASMTLTTSSKSSVSSVSSSDSSGSTSPSR